MTNQELGPDSLKKMLAENYGMSIGNNLIFGSFADAWKSDRDELAALKNPLTKVMNDETKMLLVGERATNEQLRTQLAAAKARIAELEQELDACKWEHPEYGTSEQHCVVVKNDKALEEAIDKMVDDRCNNGEEHY